VATRLVLLVIVLGWRLRQMPPEPLGPEPGSEPEPLPAA
jgi:hypothetical protein